MNGERQENGMSGVLEGKTAIVTGGARGLGAEFAGALAGAGAAVVVGDVISTEETCAAIQAAGGKALGIHLDVTDQASVSACVAKALDSFGSVDILVNNAAIAGTLGAKSLTEIESDEWDRLMAVNLRGVFECIKGVVPAMRAQGYGKIVNLASGTALKGAPGLLHYVASKGGVIALTRATARELGGFGIRVNAIAPGLTMTDTMRDSANWSAAAIANNVSSRALPREAEPFDLVGALLFLTSPSSDFITGQTLSVDGGSAMN
jgi:NAD(P)-dependent dehydrogenase (short-subunit alcohol dehydrogenase family)